MLKHAIGGHQSSFCSRVNFESTLEENNLPRALVDHRLAGQAVVSNNTKNESSEPDDQAEEGKSLRGTPLSAVVAAAQADATPSPCAATASTVKPDDEHSEDGGPTCCED